MTLKATLVSSLQGKQGLQGFSTRAGQGLPSLTTAPLAVDGDSYLDALNAAIYSARSGGTWPSPLTLLGATGNQGAAGSTLPAIGQSSYAVGPIPGSVTLVAYTATYAQMPYPGAPGNICAFTPTWTSNLASAQLVVTSANNSTVAFQLIDTNTGTVYYTSPSYAYGTVNTVTPNVTLPSGGRYVWQIKGSGSTPCTVIPTYLYPTGNGICVSNGIYSQLTNVTLSSSTPTNMRVYGSNTCVAYYINPTKNCYLYTATLNNGTNASCQFGLYNNTGAAGVVTYTVPANTTQTVGPMANGTAGLTANNQHYWRVYGTGTGNASVTWTVYS